jgi:raffinose/stachyose/melibiose transport system substrate-binding protein
MGSLLVGCGTSAQPTASTDKTTAPAAAKTEEVKKVSGELLWCSHRTDFQTTVLPDYVKEFNQKYPDVKITIETYKDYPETMKIKMSSNDMPDVWGIGPGNYTREQVQANALAVDDLDITKDFDGVDQFKGADGKVYGLPTGLGATAVVYNKKIFKDLGISIPKTQDEFIAAAKKITASGKVGLATAAKAKWPLSSFWGTIPSNISGVLDVNNTYATQDEPFTADSSIVKGWQMLKAWKDAGILEKDPLSSDWEPMKKEFRAGNVGMFYLGNWFIPQAIGDALTDADVGFFPLPYDNDPGSKNVSMGPDYGWAMSKESKVPEAQKAFFLFLTDTKYADWAKITGLLSARKSMKVDMPWVTDFMALSPKYQFGTGDSTELNDITSKVQFDKEAFAQDVLAGKDLNTMVAELNAKWKKARAK